MGIRLHRRLCPDGDLSGINLFMRGSSDIRGDAVTVEIICCTVGS